MSLLKLKNIGKIYVSEGAVTVGIRGVNLSFDKGEFVAVTGKSTLLNVISGMDSYEEGELYIEGQPTSHYMQKDWEDYRKDYISFIFQDYNIIESFTVLQNVELALMNIEDHKERRRKALELLDRVGMRPFIKQKGSKLSGGQKQRTVIARALAKDSPIILADEPTGNLDYATSAEIVALLKEVSKDKLFIMVTHNFEQVEGVATRHVRIYDGAVAEDTVFTPAPMAEEGEKSPQKDPLLFPEEKKGFKRPEIKNGFVLGKTIFLSRPLLSLFLCILMIIGSLGMFFATALCGSGVADLFSDYYMFTPQEGRVVMVKRSGEVFTPEEIEGLMTSSLTKAISFTIPICWVCPDLWIFSLPTGRITAGQTWADIPKRQTRYCFIFPLRSRPISVGPSSLSTAFRSENWYTRWWASAISATTICLRRSAFPKRASSCSPPASISLTKARRSR